MNMKQRYKVLMLIVSIFFISAFSTVDIHAQNVNKGFEGIWVMDSLQVKEVMPDSIAEKTILPSDNTHFFGSWMWQLSIGSDRKLTFTDRSGQSTSSASYTIKDRNGNAATLITDSTGDIEKRVQLTSENIMTVTQSFTILGENMQNIDVTWKMFYRKN